MKTIGSFTDLEVWKVSHRLVLEVYKITPSLPSSEKYGIMPQMQRSAVSIPANIAEGFKRRGKKEKAHFYNISQGSLEELRYYFILLRDLGFRIDVDRFNRIINRITVIFFERVIAIGGFLIGDVEVPEFDFKKGDMMMKVTDCLMLRAPRMKDFPEECCLLVCKGACEKAFDEYRTSMLFEPQLPETTCDIRFYVDDKKFVTGQAAVK